MDYTSIKKLGIDHCGIDMESSYDSFDQSNNKYTIIIHLLKEEKVHCPLCGSFEQHKNRGSKSQMIKYSCSIMDNVYIKLYRRVYQCNSCNHYFKERNPFTLERNSTALLKEVNILTALKNINATYKSVAKRFQVSPTYVTNLFDKRVDLKRLPLSDVICFDEVYSRHLSYQKYCFVMYSPIDKKIIDIIDSRRLKSLYDYFLSISMKERDKVKYISIDLYDNYRNLVLKCFPKAILCADRFHVSKNITDAFEAVRIRIMKKYETFKNENDNRYWFLKKFKKFLLKDTSKLSYKKIPTRRNKQYMSPREIIDCMLENDKELKIAYELLHEYRNYNEMATIDNAAEWLDELTLKFINSGIKEYIKIYKLLKNWRNEIINSFNIYKGFKISNGPIERINNSIKIMFRISFGIRNFPRTRNRIMYCLNENSPILNTKKEKTNKYQYKKRGKYKKR